MRHSGRPKALAALCCSSAAALAGLPTLDLYLDLRMAVREADADALELAARPDGLILWESAAAPDWGDELEGLDVIAVDPGAKNVAGLPSVRRGRAARLFEPPFDTAGGRGRLQPRRRAARRQHGGRLGARDAGRSSNLAAAAAADTARRCSCRSTTDDARAGRRKRVRGAMTGSALPTFGAADARAPAPAASASRCRPTRASGSTPRAGNIVDCEVRSVN